VTSAAATFDKSKDEQQDGRAYTALFKSSIKKAIASGLAKAAGACYI